MVLFDYISWVYSGGIKEYFRAWGNFHWFLFHFFSVGILTRTLFVPWHRMREKGGRGLDIEGALARFVVNAILRIVGIFVRLSVILTAFIFELGLFIIMLAGLILFVSSPISIPLLIISGFILAAI